MSETDLSERVRSKIRDFPDFPKPGIVFKDITPIFSHHDTLKAVTEALSARYAAQNIDAVVGIESRGFLVGAPVAFHMGAGLVLVRKQGKLPGPVVRKTYDLEYGQDTLEIQEDALRPGMRVVVMDDLLATGGTMGATLELIRDQGVEVVEAAFLVELSFLNGREKLGDVDCHAVVVF